MPEVTIATTSTRNRDPRALHAPGRNVRAPSALRLSESAALVFGPERGGLFPRRDAPVPHDARCPNEPAFPVLNLAQAVGIVLALLGAPQFELPLPPDPMDRAAPHQVFEPLSLTSRRCFWRRGTLTPEPLPGFTDQFRRWLGRTVPTRRELALLSRARSTRDLSPKKIPGGS